MDLILLLALFSVTVLILLSTVFIFFRPGQKQSKFHSNFFKHMLIFLIFKGEVQRGPIQVDGDRPRRANVVQNRRNRLRLQQGKWYI